MSRPHPAHVKSSFGKKVNLIAMARNQPTSIKIEPLAHTPSARTFDLFSACAIAFGLRFGKKVNLTFCKNGSARGWIQDSNLALLQPS
jgi:hypothetical protein